MKPLIKLLICTSLLNILVSMFLNEAGWAIFWLIVIGFAGFAHERS